MKVQKSIAFLILILSISAFSVSIKLTLEDWSNQEVLEKAGDFEYGVTFDSTRRTIGYYNGCNTCSTSYNPPSGERKGQWRSGMCTRRYCRPNKSELETNRRTLRWAVLSMVQENIQKLLATKEFGKEIKLSNEKGEWILFKVTTK